MITRGEGVVTYTITGNDGVTAYETGTIDQVEFYSYPGALTDGTIIWQVFFCLPESAVFRNREVSYIYLNLEEGAFVDVVGNPSPAIKGGKNGDSPWWNYTPDLEAPLLLRGNGENNYYHYIATNNGRTIQLIFNELIQRGEGAITYTITGEDGTTAYASGTIDNVDVTVDRATITLPESVIFDETQSYSYVFLDLAEGAFLDLNENPSAAMKGGINEYGGVDAPWWDYKTPKNLIEIGEEGYGDYHFAYTSYSGESISESVRFLLPADAGTEKYCDYALLDMGKYLYGDHVSSYIHCFIDGDVLNITNGVFVGFGTIDEVQYYIEVCAVEVDEYGSVTLVKDKLIPFVPSAEDPRILINNDVTLAYIVADIETGGAIDVVDVMTNCSFYPASMATEATALTSFSSNLLKKVKGNAVMRYLQENVKIPYLRTNWINQPLFNNRVERIPTIPQEMNLLKK